MDDHELINIIEKYSLTVRCLPRVVVNRWFRTEGWKLKDNQTFIEIEVRPGVKKEFVREENNVEKGGWWYVKETANTYGTVRFDRKYDKFFAPTLKEAIQLFLDDKQKRKI